MRQLLYLIFLGIISVNLYGQATSLVNTERGSIYSEILQIEKSYQIFLPESYNYSDSSTYPVVYLIDGDYNFYYQTGIVESLANVSEQIPELIVVGISDNGNEGYRKDCTLKSEKNPEGRAEKFISYIEKELKPFIAKKYKVSPYEILMGHSLGGLFATNVFLTRPELFSAYIAIDPSLWWADNYVSSLGDSLLKVRKEISSKYFLTLADSKQMGVHQFVEVLEKYFPDSPNWKFKYYENESHGSVGMVSVRDGLLELFKDWELKRDKFYEFETSADVVDYYKKREELYKSKLRIPPNLFSNIVYYYFRKDKMEELAILEQEVLTHFPSSIDDYYSKLASYFINTEKYDMARSLLEKSIGSNKKAYKSYDAISKLFFAQSELQQAKTYAEKAIKIAKELKVRQWQLNELESNLRKIELK